MCAYVGILREVLKSQRRTGKCKARKQVGTNILPAIVTNAIGIFLWVGILIMEGDSHIPSDVSSSIVLCALAYVALTNLSAPSPIIRGLNIRFRNLVYLMNKLHYC